MTGSPDKHADRRPAPRSYLLVDPRLATNPRKLVRFLHDDVKLTDREIGTATNNDAGTVRRWRSEKSKHAPRMIRPLDDMRVIVELLVNTGVLTLEEAGGFLRARVVPPNDEIPLAVLSSASDEGFKRVRKAAEAFIAAILVRSPAQTGDDGDTGSTDELVLLGGQADRHGRP
jgi:hypothetical protein